MLVRLVRSSLAFVALTFAAPAALAGEDPGPVAFSVEGGLYDSPFALVLSSETGAPIHWTADGSEPTEDSPLYLTPIPIAPRIGDLNVFSEIVTSPAEAWLPPGGEIFKATIIRAAALPPGSPRGPIATHTYFVDAGIHERYELPIVSIVSDPDHLFGYESGIYVPGAIYDEHYDGNVHWSERRANYQERGDAWERPASMEMFETDGTTVIRQGIGIRINGQISRAYRHKSLRIYAKSSYGASRIEYDIFGGDAPTRFRRLVLRNSGQDITKTLVRDGLQHRLAADFGVPGQAYRAAVTFVNGEYWGVMNIRERIDKYYLESRFGADPDEVDLISGDYMYEVEEGDAEDLVDLRAFIIGANLSDPEMYEYVAERLDLEDLARYLAAEIWFANLDWPQNNIDFWRSHEDGAKWRCILSDTDVAFGYRPSDQPWTFDSLSRILEGTYIPGVASPPGLNGLVFASLLEAPAFRDLFLVRYAALMNSVLVPEKVLERIDAMAGEIAGAMPEHIHRWRMHGNVEQWEQDVEVLRQFATHRSDSARAHAVAAFDLPGLAEITVQNPYPARGTLSIGGVDLSEAASPWTGVWFRDVPLIVHGSPAPGYRFLGVAGTDADEHGNIRLVPEGDAVLVARFDGCGNAVPDEDEECDDGNTAAGDGCSDVCALEGCGDGVTDAPHEECDDGDAEHAAGDACDALCRYAPCGRPMTLSKSMPTVVDVLFILKAAVGSTSCAVSVCDVDDSGDVTASDSLLALQAAVGLDVGLECPPPGQASGAP